MLMGTNAMNDTPGTDKVQRAMLDQAAQWRKAHGSALEKEWSSSSTDHLDKWIAMGLAIWETHHVTTPTLKQMRRAIEEAASAMSCAYVLGLFPEEGNSDEAG